LVFLTIAGLGCSLAATQPISAGGRIVGADPNCDEYCQPTCCQQFCRTLKLHAVYFKRSCSQKFILVPTGQPYGCPAPDSPTYSSPYAYPTINGYGTSVNGYGVPPVNSAPPGVFIR
jgi:hypothetical protein